MQLGRRLEDGATLRQHLQRAYENTRRADPLLDAPPVPRAARAVWEAFVQLASSRASGMGLSPISLADIEAWCRLSGITLTPWELDTLLALDAAALTEAAKRMKH